MKVSSKLFLLVFFVLTVFAFQFLAQRHFNSRIADMNRLIKDFGGAGEDLLSGIIAEKEYLNDHDLGTAADVRRRVTAADARFDAGAAKVSEGLQSDVGDLRRMLNAYLSAFDDLALMIVDFDMQLEDLNSRIRGMNRRAVSVIQQARNDIGMAMINVEPVDENVRNVSESAKDAMLWVRQASLALNQDLLVKGDAAAYHDKMAVILEELAGERKNAEIISKYFPEDGVYGAYLTEVRDLMDWLPGSLEEISAVHGRKAAQAVKLDAFREKLLAARDALIAGLDQETVRAGRRLGYTAFLSFFIAALAMILGGAGIAASISSPLSRIIGTVQEAAAQIAAASGQVADGSQTLSVAAGQAGSAVGGITVSIGKIAEGCRQTAALTDGAGTLMGLNIRKSAQSLKSLVRLTKSMARVRADSGEISRITKTINEIAFQTNLLALNAAVEAARAGEAGAGFSVVAEEVRSLAARSAEAARETEDLLQNNIRRVGEAARSLEEMSADFEGIIESATSIGEKTEAITRASEGLAGDMEQITGAARELEDMSGQAAAWAEESAAAAEEMSAQAASLQDTVAGLAAIVEGKKRRVNRMKQQKEKRRPHEIDDEKRYLPDHLPDDGVMRVGDGGNGAADGPGRPRL